MSERHFVGLDLTSFDDKKQLRPISRVTFVIDDETSVTAGDDTGLEIRANNPYATQEMAESVLARLKGYQYQMLEAGGASLDPAAEPGDGITAGGVYSFIGRLSDAGGYPDIAAPGEAEMDDEYPSSEGPMTRANNQKLAKIRSRITKTAQEIRLEIAELDGKTSSITQTVDSITQRVQGLDGKFAEVQLTLDGLTVTGPDGTTYIRDSSIRTGSITADKLNIKGSISFADLEQDVVDEITSGITSTQARTLINSTLVSSPNIAGGKFWNVQRDSWLEMGSSSSTVGTFRLCNENSPSDSPYFSVYSIDGLVTYLGAHNNFFLSVIKKSPYLLVQPEGTWDFSYATVTGVTAVFT